MTMADDDKPVPIDETISYLFQHIDTKMSDDISAVVERAQPTVDTALATLATALAMHLASVPEPDENVLIKVQWLNYFITLQVSSYRGMLSAARDGTKH
jgi:hypothetical protein